MRCVLFRIYFLYFKFLLKETIKNTHSHTLDSIWQRKKEIKSNMILIETLKIREKKTLTQQTSEENKMLSEQKKISTLIG